MKLTEKFFVTGKGITILAELEANEKMPELGAVIKFQNKKYKITGIEYRLGAVGINSHIALVVRERK